MCVRDQALLYYRLLQCGVDKTRRVLQGRRSDPSLGVLIGRPAEPVRHWARVFNTLKPLWQSFSETESVRGRSCQDTAFEPNSDLSDALTSCQLESVQTGEFDDEKRWHLFCCVLESKVSPF